MLFLSLDTLLPNSTKVDSEMPPRQHHLIDARFFGMEEVLVLFPVAHPQEIIDFFAGFPLGCSVVYLLLDWRFLFS